jgi:hypothetical protein
VPQCDGERSLPDGGRRIPNEIKEASDTVRTGALFVTMCALFVPMSALGHKQTCAVQKGMSALLPKADMCGAQAYGHFVPIADIVSPHSTSSSARCCRSDGTSNPSPFAVLRLIDNTNFEGNCTGKSAGFAPLSMRST